jgi:hypothetical protein
VFIAGTTFDSLGATSEKSRSISSLFFLVSLFSTKHFSIKSTLLFVSELNISPKTLFMIGVILELKGFLISSFSFCVIFENNV